jgi:hypothetical protein
VDRLNKLHRSKPNDIGFSTALATLEPDLRLRRIPGQSSTFWEFFFEMTSFENHFVVLSDVSNTNQRSKIRIIFLIPYPREMMGEPRRYPPSTRNLTIADGYKRTGPREYMSQRVLRHGICRRDVSTQMCFFHPAYTLSESCFSFGRPEIRSTRSRFTRKSSVHVRQPGTAIYV